jgi:hypothetical protein
MSMGIRPLGSNLQQNAAHPKRSGFRSVRNDGHARARIFIVPEISRVGNGWAAGARGLRAILAARASGRPPVPGAQEKTNTMQKYRLALSSGLWFLALGCFAQDSTMALQQLQDRIVHTMLAGEIDDYISCSLPLTVPSAPPTLAGTLNQLRTVKGIDIDARAFAAELSANTRYPAGIAAAVAKAIPRQNKTAEQYGRETREAAGSLTAAIAANLAPGDVACVMTLLPWQVTADNFGRHVADQYLAFQVVVRNLNPTNQFLLHNVSVSADGSAFHAGVDKMLVRGSQSHGEAYDRRNFVSRLIETVAGIAVGAASYGSRDVQAGAGVFQALFVPGVEKAFPDRYASQINALNDLAFSSASSYSVVVPPKGSTPFVTFLPAALLPDKAAYKHWPPAQLDTFLERSFVVVSGVHIQEVSTGAASEKP